ncbi:MAG: 2-iminobutanoate/2-iminopropanoate deaminase [Solirubrobacteraceae bacterium]|jgi:2-iminobutanoate/2-iminopropanoate deaminase|nr:2-iminobutanoate/2-iminopropanoate deaminase [Solirubrobacteraceae bacterium]MEA2316157.1 2-iminobutanoate/2-iminopropanoate deaminase [Solirubrobacteraceae bacterium]
MIERLMAPGTFHQAPYSHAVRAGNFLFVTGQIAADPETGDYVLGDIETETRRTMDNLQLVLGTAGFGFGDVVAARAFLTDMRDYDEFNRIYTEYTGDALPMRTCIGVTALAAGARVEVDLVAYRE